jgi:Outer membrane protein beta-barrel domain
MIKNYLWLLAGCACMLACAPAQAQWYENNKFEVTPFVGFETSSSYPLNNENTTSPITGLRSNAATSFGTFIDYNLTTNFQAEFMWDRNWTSYSEQVYPNPQYVQAFNSDIDQYQFGFDYMVLGDEHKIRPYFAGSLGFTHEFNSGGTPNRTDFAYGLGGGVKYELNSHIGFRGDLRYLPTYANTALGEYCGPFGCYLANVRQYQSRGNFVAGVIFKF